MPLSSNSTSVRSTWDYGEAEPLPGAPPVPPPLPPPGGDARFTEQDFAVVPENLNDDSADAKDDAEDELIGHALEGRYVLHERIGEGTFGTVYRGFHNKLARPVAIKVLSDTIAIHKQWVRRFEQEAQILARVASQFTASVFDSGFDDKAGYFIVMEYLHGTDLADRIFDRGPLGVLDFYTVLEQVGVALGAAHDAGVVHLDIKSENIFLVEPRTPDETLGVKLLDFGISRLQHPSGGDGASEDAPCGSPYTMSPEAIRSEQLTARSDLYSLGAVLYEALTGLPPFDAGSVQSLLYKHLYEDPPNASEEEGADWIPPSIDALLKKMLAKAPGDRPRSVRDLVDDFEALRDVTERAWAERYLVPAHTTKLSHRDRRPGEPGSIAQRQRARTLQIDTKAVLVIDDDPLFRQLLRRKLASQGLHVHTSHTTADGLAYLQTTHPLAVVCDLLMPVDGVTTIRFIRASDYSGAIYVLSGLTETAMAEAALRAGADEIFSKDHYGELAIRLQRLRATLEEGE